MNRIKIWLIIVSVLLILLDRFSFISKIRDSLAMYIQKETASTIYRIKNYPKLVLLQHGKERQLETENINLRKQVLQYSLELKQQNNQKLDEKEVQALTSNPSLYHEFQTVIARAVIDINYLVNSKLLIDKGTINKIVTGNAVVNKYGLIGQVGEVNSQNAQVILITNPNFKIFLQDNKSQSKMLAQGIGNNNILVKYISKNQKLKVGDILSTTGLDNVYPANIPVAKIIKIFYENNGFNSALCEPVVNFNKLQYVLVLKNANQ